LLAATTEAYCQFWSPTGAGLPMSY